MSSTELNRISKYNFHMDCLFDPLNKLSDEQLAHLKAFGLKHSLILKRYTFSLAFQPFSVKDFLLDLFCDENFRESFLMANSVGAKKMQFSNVKRVDYKDASVDYYTLEGLMPAISEMFINGDTFRGIVPKKLQNVDLEVTTELDEAMFDGESERFNYLPEYWRDELMCRLLMLLRAGGALNQQDDKYEVYTALVKYLYRHMVSPVKIDGKEDITLSHLHAYFITDVDFMGTLFPKQTDYDLHPGNLCVVVVDELKRTATVLYNNVYL